MDRSLLARNRYKFALACLMALLLAACAPQATPAPTDAPEPEEVEEQVAEETEAADETEEQPTDAPADETEAAGDEADDADATDAADAGDDADATEAADAEDNPDATEADGEETDDGDATEAAGDADATDEADGGGTGADASGEGFPAVVSVSTTRLRDRPSVAGQVVADLTKDQPVTILGQTPDAGYAFVRLEDGTEGWVAKQTLQLENERATIPVITP